jgi:hypothetical protein
VEVESALVPKKRKAPSGANGAKQKSKGGSSLMTALERKKKEALSSSPDEDEEGFINLIPVTKK